MKKQKKKKSFILLLFICVSTVAFALQSQTELKKSAIAEAYRYEEEEDFSYSALQNQENYTGNISLGRKSTVSSQASDNFGIYKGNLYWELIDTGTGDIPEHTAYIEAGRRRNTYKLTIEPFSFKVGIATISIPKVEINNLQLDENGLFIKRETAIPISVDIIFKKQTHNIKTALSGKQSFMKGDNKIRLEFLTEEIDELGGPYQVKIIYDGELREKLNTDDNQEETSVYSQNKKIFIKGADSKPIRVYTVTGDLIGVFTGQEITEIGLQEGVYYLNIDGKTEKIFVP